jgi:4a-hydroxytetrahydrobiopterin dehydratase
LTGPAHAATYESSRRHNGLSENCKGSEVGMSEVLQGEARAQALSELDGWQEVEGRDAIAKTFKFKDFGSAFAWMTRVAMAAEIADHHPEWSNVYNKVEVTLSTHDAGGVTEKDVSLARRMDRFASD